MLVSVCVTACGALVEVGRQHLGDVGDGVARRLQVGRHGLGVEPEGAGDGRSDGQGVVADGCECVDHRHRVLGEDVGQHVGHRGEAVAGLLEQGGHGGGRIAEDRLERPGYLVDSVSDRVEDAEHLRVHVGVHRLEGAGHLGGGVAEPGQDRGDGLGPQAVRRRWSPRTSSPVRSYSRHSRECHATLHELERRCTKARCLAGSATGFPSGPSGTAPDNSGGTSHRGDSHSSSVH